MNGRCVRLVKGDFEQATVYSEDPATIAIDFARAGAVRLHVVDLDAARGEMDNRSAVESVIDAGLTVQDAGRVRSAAPGQTWPSARSGKVVTAAAQAHGPV